MIAKREGGHRINRMKIKRTYILVLPHHDDEIFLVQFLHTLSFTNTEPYELIFFYATYDKKSPARVFENKKFLARIIKDNYSIVNFGMDAKITPRALVAHLNELESELLKLINSVDSKVTLVFPSLEFGHIDHDVTSLICLRIQNDHIAEKIGYSTYRLDQLFDRFPFFRVATIRIPLLKIMTFEQRKQIFLNIVHGFHEYRSQRSTWIKLGPSLIFINWFCNSQNWEILNDNEKFRLQLLRENDIVISPIEYKYFPKWSTRNYLVSKK